MNKLLRMGILIPLVVVVLFFGVHYYSLAAGQNLILNPTLALATVSSTTPDDWTTDSYGNNTPQFSYLNTGNVSPFSLLINMSNYVDGDAKWDFAAVPATPNTEYTYSDSYKSDVVTSIIVKSMDASGNATFNSVATEPASPSAFSTTLVTFQTPSNTNTLQVLHVIQSNGMLQTGDFSLMTAAATSSMPSVSVTAPLSNAMITGTTTVSANATDANGIENVQFQLDGMNVGSVITTAPYQFVWDSTTVTNGAHMIDAVATNVNNVVATSTSVSITVNNPIVVTSSNLIPNPTLALATVSSTTPDDWMTDGYGTNSPVFSYLDTGNVSPHSLLINMSNYVNGDAKWDFTPVTVSPNTEYTFSDSYMSNVDTSILARSVDASDNVSYITIASDVPASTSTWSQAMYTFQTLPTTNTLTIMHLIQSNGMLQTGDFSLVAGTSSTQLPITINPLTLPDGVIGTPYSQTLMASTTLAAPFTWTVSSGALPAGLSLDPSLAIILGTPTATGTSAFDVMVTNGTASTTQAFTLNIDASSTATTSPLVIVLNGDATMNLNINDNFIDPGATTTDSVVGATSTITVGGDTVNTTVAGTYNVTYNAVDSAGNHAAQVTRTVIVGASQTQSSSGGGATSLGSSGGSFFNNTSSIYTSNCPVGDLFYVNNAVKCIVNGTTTVQTSSPTGRVLGTSTYQFTYYLKQGSSSDAVRQLQERLRANGYFTFPTSTGYFGPITLAAVKAYQAAHGIPATGYVGPLTVSQLNKQD